MIERLEELADKLLTSASQYQVIRELSEMEEPLDEDERIYKNFLLAVLMSLDYDDGYEH